MSANLLKDTFLGVGGTCDWLSTLEPAVAASAAKPVLDGTLSGAAITFARKEKYQIILNMHKERFEDNNQYIPDSQCTVCGD